MVSQFPNIKLSPYHEIFYNEWKLNPLRSEYNLVSDNEMHGVIEPARLDRALARMSKDYLLLHSVIQEIDGNYYWKRDPQKRISFTYVDTPQTDEQLLKFVKAPFNLNRDSLIRVALIKLADAHFRIVLVVHHLIMDGAKESFTFSTISKYFNDKNYSCDVSIEKQHELLKNFSQKYTALVAANEQAHTKFWSDQLSELPGIDLSFLKNYKEDKSDNEIGEQRFSFNEKILRKLRHVSKKNAITPYLLSLVVFAALVYRYNQQEEFGFCISVEIPEGDEFYYGASVNPIAIPFKFTPAKTLVDLINELKNYFKLIKADNHHHFPLQRLPITAIQRDLFEVGFTKTHLKQLQYRLQNTCDEKINSSLNVDLSGKLLFYQEIKNELVNHCVLFKKTSIDSELLSNFIKTYQRIFEDIIDDLYEGRESTPVTSYNLLEPAAFELIAREWNRTDYPFPDQSLQQLFEERVEQSPEAIAVVFDDQKWSYQELNRDSNRIAHYLRHHFSIQPEDLIGLCLTPGYRSIVALWAVIKSGAAYVPIDPTTPSDRVSFIIDDTKAKVVLVDQVTEKNPFQKLSDRIDKHIALINLDSNELESTLIEFSTENPISLTLPNHLLYVIFTSGTQGQPKGVMIEHRSMVNYATYLIRDNQLSTDTITSQFAAASFDCSAMETYPTFLAGGTLCIIKAEDRLDCNKVNAFLHRHKVNYAFFPTSFAEIFLTLKNYSLKTLMICGEKLNRYIPQPYRVINAYGPTEATVHTTGFSPDRAYLNIPIGRPISNMKCYVVDAQFKLLPIGSVGELMIGGIGVARKYLNRPDLTERCFVANPFQTEHEMVSNENSRLYKTGDFVRWLPDGNLEFIKRLDDQIKIRGYRVELSEIQRQLMAYPGIKQVALKVFNKTENENIKSLVAFYIAAAPFKAESLSQFLAQHLPYYMLPSAYVHLEQLPVTSHGKLDENQLQCPEIELSIAYEKPENLTEKIVCAAFAKILSFDPDCIGRNHDFLEMGGDSLSAIRLTMLLSSRFKISTSDIFQLKTPAKIAMAITPMQPNIPQQVAQIKKLYKNKISFAEQDYKVPGFNKEFERQYKQYLSNNTGIEYNPDSANSIQSILLTGATGFLGAHILNTLLTKTSCFIYLPVRGSADTIAFDRLNAKYSFYFGKDLNDYRDRIDVFSAKLEKADFGLDASRLNHLAGQLDNIIHCAALVKYFGPAEDYFQSNVQPTRNLLELASLTKGKNFHYISTVGVLLDGYVADQEHYLFTEVSDVTKLVRASHPYMHSKYQSEQLVEEYRLKGINGNIHRVGNLVMNSLTHITQENIDDNLLFAHVRAMMNLKILPEEIANIEISPVDCAALAIVKLIEQCPLKNQTYHIFNPHTFNLKKALNIGNQLGSTRASIETFINEVITLASSPDGAGQCTYFHFLYQFWMTAVDDNHSTCIRVAQDRTEHLLSRVGFHWPTITPDMLSVMVQKTFSTASTTIEKNND